MRKLHIAKRANTLAETVEQRAATNVPEDPLEAAVHRLEGLGSNPVPARFAETVASFASALMEDGPGGIGVSDRGLQTGVTSSHLGLALVFPRVGAADR